VNRYYSRAHDFGLAWDDRNLAIDWPVPRDRALLSEKDLPAAAGRIADAFPLRIARFC
jgi:dTDP-4-dehydrorhamnose 3,5-epimerase-like enzyme